MRPVSATLLIVLLLTLPSAAQDTNTKPLAVYFEEDSCDFSLGAWNALSIFFAKFERESQSHGVPAYVTVRRDKSDYIVQWGRLLPGLDRITGKPECARELMIAHGDTGRMLYHRELMAIQEGNRFKDFFAVLKDLQVKK
jgi:hypothetical protein